MEISLREWLVIGGVVVIALIVFDGWRRVRGGRSSLRMDIDRRLKNQAEDADEPNNPELPYGGARPAGDSVTESEPRPAAKPAPSQPARRAVAQSASERIEPTFGDEPDPDARAGSVAAPQPSLSAFDPDDDVDPLFDEPAAAQVERQQPEAPPSVQPAGKKQEPEPVAARAASPEPGPEPVRQSVEIPQSPPRGPFAPAASVGADPLFDEIADDAPVEAPAEAPEVDLEKPVPMLMQRVRRPRTPEPEPEAVQQSEMPLGPVPENAGTAPVAKPRPARAASMPTPEPPQQDSLFAETKAGRAPESAGQMASPELPDPENVLVITAVSTRDEGFPGAGLYRILKACDLHFGEMDIFHRHEDGSDSGPVQFSMANAVNPGTFDLATIDGMHTPGVTFFMSMEEPRDVMNAFECMLATAETLARHLHGDLLDENHSVLRPQTKEHYRQRIRDFEMHNRSRRNVSRA